MSRFFVYIMPSFSPSLWFPHPPSESVTKSHACLPVTLSSFCRYVILSKFVIMSFCLKNGSSAKCVDAFRSALT